MDMNKVKQKEPRYPRGRITNPCAIRNNNPRVINTQFPRGSITEFPHGSLQAYVILVKVAYPVEE
eukprot:3360756-Heterocapsa_arctica.AAC.1